MLLKRARNHVLRPVLKAFEKITGDDIGSGLVGAAAELFIHVGYDPVVAVHEAQILPFCQRQCKISRPPLSAVFHMQAANLLGIFRGIAVGNLSR